MMEIEKLKTKHIKECIDLFIRVFNSDPWNDEWTKDKAEKVFMQLINTPGFIGYIGLIDKKISSACLGHVKTWWDGKDFYIEELFVDNKYQRTGVGSELLRFVEADVKQFQVKSIILATTRDFPSEKFYKKQGYVNLDAMTFMTKSIL